MVSMGEADVINEEQNWLFSNEDDLSRYLGRSYGSPTCIKYLYGSCEDQYIFWYREGTEGTTPASMVTKVTEERLLPRFHTPPVIQRRIGPVIRISPAKTGAVNY